MIADKGKMVDYLKKESQVKNDENILPGLEFALDLLLGKYLDLESTKVDIEVSKVEVQIKKNWNKRQRE